MALQARYDHEGLDLGDRTLFPVHQTGGTGSDRGSQFPEITRDGWLRVLGEIEFLQERNGELECLLRKARQENDTSSGRIQNLENIVQILVKRVKKTEDDHRQWRQEERDTYEREAKRAEDRHQREQDRDNQLIDNLYHEVDQYRDIYKQLAYQL
jgi:hypothetical protein